VTSGADHVLHVQNAYAQGFRIGDAVRRLWSGERELSRLVAGLSMNEQSVSLVQLLLRARDEDEGPAEAEQAAFTHCVFVTNQSGMRPLDLAGHTADVVAQTVVDESQLGSATAQHWNMCGWNGEAEFRSEYRASMEHGGRGLCARSLVSFPCPCSRSRALVVCCSIGRGFEENRRARGHRG
jgi:hypothetical protein